MKLVNTHWRLNTLKFNSIFTLIYNNTIVNKNKVSMLTKKKKEEEGVNNNHLS